MRKYWFGEENDNIFQLGPQPENPLVLRINSMHPYYDGSQYMVIFPHGAPTWSPFMTRKAVGGKYPAKISGVLLQQLDPSASW